jgi:hypothetical protein
MEFSLSKQEWAILKIVAGTWTAYQWWDIIVNFDEKFPASARLWRRLTAGDIENEA